MRHPPEERPAGALRVTAGMTALLVLTALMPTFITCEWPHEPSGSPDAAVLASAEVTLPSTIVSLVSLHGRGRCLDAERVNGAATGAVQTFQCTVDNPNQRWSWNGRSLVAADGRCVSAEPDASGNAKLADCASPSSQRFGTTSDERVSTAEGICVDAVALGAENAARVALRSCNGSLTQRWVFRAPLTDAAVTARVWRTAADQTALVARQPDIMTADTPETLPTIAVDDRDVGQTIEGFGGALTDSTAWLLTHVLDDAGRAAFLTMLFDPDAGIGLDYVRIPLGSSDFALSQYTYDDMPAGRSDPALAQFSVAHDDAYILPMARAIAAVNPRVRFMGCPWSAPAWMKTGQSLVGGSLVKSEFPTYAAYLLRAVEAFDASGVPLATLAIQNEPLFEAPDYPSMRMEAADEADLVANNVGPLFAASDVGRRTGIIAYDHNWDRSDYPLTVLGSDRARAFVRGSSFHCYAGAVEAQSTVHDAFPDKDIFFTECTGFGANRDFASDLAYGAKTIILGTTKNWATTVLYFNLLLDDASGPHMGGCTSCRGLATVNRASGAISYNVELYVLAHMSKFVMPGAHRVGATDVAGLTLVTFLDPDGGHVLVALSTSGDDVRARITQGARTFITTIPSKALVTIVW